MLRAKAIKTVFLWDWELQYRRSSGWFVSLLFSAVVTFLTSLLIKNPTANTWLALMWMILIFSAIQIASKAFSANDGQYYYINQLVNPLELLIGKSLSTSFSTLLISLLSFLLFYIWVGFPNISDHQTPLFPLLISISLGSVALSFTLSFTSAIASKVDGNTSLMSILSIPLLLPTLLVSLRASKLALLGQSIEQIYPIWIGELSLCGLSLALGAILFPYLWRS
ncbi:MAG: heme exporter protein CcmB [Schleiferiaceae bacterium]|nr:heme exporter protein CcmB [Schleiferiaceae bacterium]